MPRPTTRQRAWVVTGGYLALGSGFAGLAVRAMIEHDWPLSFLPLTTGLAVGAVGFGSDRQKRARQNLHPSRHRSRTPFLLSTPIAVCAGAAVLYPVLPPLAFAFFGGVSGALMVPTGLWSARQLLRDPEWADVLLRVRRRRRLSRIAKT
jgi:hypothetical protein